MIHCVSRLLLATCLLLGAGLVSGCETLGITDNTYTLKIRQAGGHETSLQSLYVIVAPKEIVGEKLEDSSQYAGLLDQELQKRYTSFHQYRPLAPDTWRLNYKGRENANVKLTIKKQVLTVALNKKLIGSGATEYNLVVLAFFGADGFELVSIDHPPLAASEDHELEVGTGNLTLQAGE